MSSSGANKVHPFSFPGSIPVFSGATDMTFYLLFSIALYWFAPVPCEDIPVSGYTVEGIRVIDAYDTEDGYYVFAPLAGQAISGDIVVFVHGYGALNPMVYGSWLRHLVNQGHHVIFPRYQEKILSTAPGDFVPNTASAIVHAIETIRTSAPQVRTETMYLCGHSYGGVILANIASHWESFGLPEPRITMLCEPGSGPFRGGVLDSYEMLHPSTQLVIVVGDNDQTVGQSLGKKIFESAVNTPNRILLWQYASKHNDIHQVGASHYEPYAMDLSFDNGIENLTTRRAHKLARTDQIDTLGYWKIFDLLIHRACEGNGTNAFTQTECTTFASLGNWPDGTPLRPMDIFTPNANASGNTAK